MRRNEECVFIISPLFLHLLRSPPPERITQAMPVQLAATNNTELKRQVHELRHPDDAIQTIRCNKCFRVLSQDRFLLFNASVLRWGRSAVQSRVNGTAH